MFDFSNNETKYVTGLIPDCQYHCADMSRQYSIASRNELNAQSILINEPQVTSATIMAIDRSSMLYSPYRHNYHSHTLLVGNRFSSGRPTLLKIAPLRQSFRVTFGEESEPSGKKPLICLLQIINQIL